MIIYFILQLLQVKLFDLCFGDIWLLLVYVIEYSVGLDLCVVLEIELIL